MSFCAHPAQLILLDLCECVIYSVRQCAPMRKIDLLEWFAGMLH